MPYMVNGLSDIPDYNILMKNEIKELSLLNW